MLAEPGERVVVEHFAPGVRVVAGGIAAVPDVGEVGAVVTRRDFGHVDVEALERRRFECVDVRWNRAVRQRVPGEVEQRSGQDLGHRKALIERLRILDLRHQRRRHRRARLIMFGVVGENGRVERPMLVELRWELDEIARHIRPRERRILHV